VSDVTVSIVHASRPELTLDCLESLHEDAGRRRAIEIVVLDNATGDDLISSVRKRFPDVRILEQSHKAGFGANQNTIVRATSGRYVFVLNPDTRVLPGAIDALANYLDAHPQVAVAGPLIRGFDGKQQGSAWRLMSIPVQLVWALTLGQLGAVVSRGSRPKRVGAVSGSAMLLRRDAFDVAGGFDERYFMFGEEADLARRLERLGLELHYVPSAEVLHHGQASTGAVPERQVNETWRSLDLYLSRYHSPSAARALRWLTGLGYALAVPAALARSVVTGRERESARLYRLHVRNAFRGVRDPGLRELAEPRQRGA
jgi:N-acetylglucosaminyl-diphospho-decaprenol L-rhamnosyltransferase